MPSLDEAIFDGASTRNPNSVAQKRMKNNLDHVLTTAQALPFIPSSCVLLKMKAPRPIVHKTRR